MCLKKLFSLTPLVVGGKHHLLGVSTPWRSSLSPSCMALVFCSTLCSTSTGFSLMNKQKHKAWKPCFHPGAPLVQSAMASCNQRRVFPLSSIFFQNCIICRPSISTESEDAGFEFRMYTVVGQSCFHPGAWFILATEAILHKY